MCYLHKLLVTTATVLLSPYSNANDLIDAHTEAIGGSAAIAKIETVHRKSSLAGAGSFGRIAGTGEQFIDAKKDRGRTGLKIYGYERQTGWVGDSGWTKDTESGERIASAEEVAIERLLAGPSAVIATIRAGAPDDFAIKGKAVFNDQSCIALELKNSEMKFYIDASTKLLIGVVSPGILEVRYEEHKAFGGVLFPTKTTMKLHTQKLTVIHQYEETKLNVDLDKDLFTSPGHSSEESHQVEELQGTVAKIMKAMDKDADGKIARSEASEDLILFFAEIDANSDGWVDSKEALVMAKSLLSVRARQKGSSEPKMRDDGAKTIVDSMDDDGDGKISTNEASAELKPYFASIDIDSDGYIDVDEAEVIAEYAK